MKHAFTVDLEDWFDGIPIDAATKAAVERRLEVGADRLLHLLADRKVRATFFVLGGVAKAYPALLHRISDLGHEIGSHGLSHDLIYSMSPERFRDETRRSMRDIEDCIGKPVRSYRAAYFSITRQSFWALEILAGDGIRFDSSIFPVNNWRYGINDYSRTPLVIRTANGPILEFPVSTRRFMRWNVPTTGGAYFRIYPYWITRSNIKRNEEEGLPVVFYLHPWELDPQHPVVRFHYKAMATHYVNLRSTTARLQRLLSDFEFTTLSEVLSARFPEVSAQLF